MEKRVPLELTEEQFTILVMLVNYAIHSIHPTSDIAHNIMAMERASTSLKRVGLVKTAEIVRIVRDAGKEHISNTGNKS